MDDKKFVSRGGIKLEHALKTFNINVSGLTALDVGSSTGGFVDCLLQYGAAKVYSVDTAYGELAWKLRQDPRVVVIERQNILFLEALSSPQSAHPSHPPIPQIDLITIDVTFTSLSKILPKIKEFLKPQGNIIALLKPQYEDQKLAMKNKGVIPETESESIVSNIIASAQEQGWIVINKTTSPIEGKDGNTEYLLLLSTS